MFVIKRDGTSEEMSYDKIVQRLKQVGHGLNIQYSQLVLKIMDQLHTNIQTNKIDEMISEQCAMMGIVHYDYSVLAGRLVLSNHRKEVPASFEMYLETIRQNENYISDTFYAIAKKTRRLFRKHLAT